MIATKIENIRNKEETLVGANLRNHSNLTNSTAEIPPAKDNRCHVSEYFVAKPITPISPNAKNGSEGMLPIASAKRGSDR